MTSLRLAAALAALSLLACGKKDDPTPAPAVDAGVADAGPVAARRPPADPANAALDLYAAVGETSATLTWVPRFSLAGVVKYAVDYGGADGSYGTTVESSGDSVTLDKLTTGASYRLFVSGLTSTGNVAPEPDAQGARPSGVPVAQTVDRTLVPGTVKFGTDRDTLSDAALDSPQAFGFDTARITVIARDSGDLTAFVSQSRGASFEKRPIDTVAQPPRAAADPSRGIIVVCYGKSDGLWTATSTDKGRSWVKKSLAALDGPACSVALGKDGVFLIAAESAAAKKVHVFRSTDGLTFEAAVTGADVSTGDLRSANPVIAADTRRGKVYLAYVQGGSDSDVLVSHSDDNGRTFVSNGGLVAGVLAHDPSRSDQDAPSITVDPLTGRLFVAWEDHKVGSLVLLAISDDGGSTLGTSLGWQPGADLGSGVGRSSATLRPLPGGKVLVAFSGAATSVTKRPYLTRFDPDGNNRLGLFDNPDGAGPKSKPLSAAGTIASGSAGGPSLGGDGQLSTYVVWATSQQGQRGDLGIVIAP